MKQELNEYPYLQVVCDWLDMIILSDWDIPVDEDGQPQFDQLKTLFYIGWRTDLDAGIHGGAITPSFETHKALERWVIEHFIDVLLDNTPPEVLKQESEKYADLLSGTGYFEVKRKY